MSAFIVAPETMQAVVTALVAMDKLYQDVGVSSCAAADKLGQDLYRMNHAAYNARYPDMAGEHNFESESFEWNLKGNGDISQDGKMCRLKAVQCLMYQCQVGDVAETWHEYRTLETAEKRLMQEIIDELPGYKAAPWD